MAIRDYIPFAQKDAGDFFAKTIEPDEIKSFTKLLKPAALALGYQGSVYYFNARATFEPNPYDLHRIMQAVDTDSYVKQATLKYKELFWKEGWRIVGENPEAVAYLHQRIDFMEMAMKRPFSEFLIEISDHLIKYSNVFIVRARADMKSFYPTQLKGVNAEQPIIGYYLIPTEQVRILRDRFNRPKSYQQQVDPFTYSPADKVPVWSADRVIHLAFDKKAGRAFGTPFMSAVLDDVVALRQLEEDIQNLVHRELFPLYKYKIGTAEQPAEPWEIDQAQFEVENMRSEGGLILPYRHDVEIVGSNSAALRAEEYLNHFKERVAIGLGVSPHHLGMSMNGGNRSMTDRLDTALYDKVKQYQRQFAEMIRVHIFNELLFEGGFDPIVNPVNEGISDRCFFKFNEIDVDTQVKKETHLMQKYLNSTITLHETRLDLGLNADVDVSELYPGIQAAVELEKMSQSLDIMPSNQQPSYQPGVPNKEPYKAHSEPGPAPKANSDKQTPAKKGQVNQTSNRRGGGNIIRPANQYGKKNSPDIRRADLSWLTVIENALKEEYNVIEKDKDEKEKLTNED